MSSERAQWFPNGALPSWTVYCVDPVSVPGKLVVLCVGNVEREIDPGDYIVRTDRGLEVERQSPNMQERGRTR